MSFVHEEQGCQELWEYLKKVAMRPNEASTKARDLTRLVTRSCDPSAS
jgi:hypothetical protein